MKITKTIDFSPIMQFTLSTSTLSLARMSPSQAPYFSEYFPDQIFCKTKKTSLCNYSLFICGNWYKRCKFTLTMSVREKKKYQWMAIATGVFLLLVKLYAWWVTGSNAILSDALESIVNVIASSFALYSVVLSAVPQDKNHPYGHGKIEFLSVGLEGSLIMIAGMATIAKAIYNFIHPQEISSIETGFALTAFSGLINFGMSRILVKKGTELNSISMTGDGRHLMTDVYSSMGLLAGLTVIYFTGMVWLDNLIAIGFSAFIIYSGYRLLRDSVSGIMDEADLKLIMKVVKILNQHRRKNWIDVHNLRIIKYGHGLHIDCHATIPWYFTLRESHTEVKLIDELISRNLPNEVEFFIHADPCEPPRSCAICIKDNCSVRQEVFKESVEWKLENVLINEKHDLRTLRTGRNLQPPP